MNQTECAKRGCSYYWQDENEAYPRCHFERIADWDLAPCEYDDEPFEPEEDEDAVYEPDDIDSDEGFDPYEGCFTWDC